MKRYATLYCDLASGTVRQCTVPQKITGNLWYYTAKDAQTKQALILHINNKGQWQGGVNE